MEEHVDGLSLHMDPKLRPVRPRTMIAAPTSELIHEKALLPHFANLVCEQAAHGKRSEESRPIVVGHPKGPIIGGLMLKLLLQRCSHFTRVVAVGSGPLFHPPRIAQLDQALVTARHTTLQNGIRMPHKQAPAVITFAGALDGASHEKSLGIKVHELVPHAGIARPVECQMLASFARQYTQSLGKISTGNVLIASVELGERLFHLGRRGGNN